MTAAIVVLAFVSRALDRLICAAIARSQRLEADERRRARAQRLRTAARQAHRSAECAGVRDQGILERRP